MNYTDYVAAMSTLMVTQPSSTPFVTILPSVINYAEQRIYRDLDHIAASVVDTTKFFTPGNRAITLAPFVILDQVNVISPVGATAITGQRNQLTAVDASYLDAVWSSSNNPGLPKFFALLTQNPTTNSPTIIVGPWPDVAYAVEAIGVQRPTPLSSGNITTFLTLFLPDLFIAASMVFASGYMRNFGSQSDDPRMSQSWETQYQALLVSAKAEEVRKQFAGPGWTSQAEVAQPQNR